MINLLKIRHGLILAFCVHIALVMYTTGTYAQIGTPVEVSGSLLESNGATAVPSTSATPSNSVLVIALLGQRTSGQRSVDSVNATFTTSPSNDRTDWTSISTTREASSAECHLAYAFASASPGAGVVTFYMSGNGLRQVVYLVEVSGVDTSTPISESNNGNGSATTANISVGGVAGNNITFSVIASRSSSGTITPGTGETEIVEHEHASSLPMNVQTQHSTDTNHDWASLGDSHGFIILEIVEAAAGAARRVIVVN